ncbi:MAG TPA: biotin/lipoyl-containing protein [Capsulimonadaceae bacterium]|jgi:biotin carboxyl carrier protein
MTVNDIQNLINLLSETSGVTELSVTASDGSEATVKRPSQAVTVSLAATPVAASSAVDEVAVSEPTLNGDAASQVDELSNVASTMVGIFHTLNPEIEVGAELRAGQKVGSIESIKLMNDVVSTASGVVAEVLIEDGQPVEYGQVLYRVSPRPFE